LSNVQRFHYLIASLKGEPRQLIANLATTNHNFSIAWNLIVERYNNIKLIAMTHVGLLMEMPQVKKGDAASLRHLINHVSSNCNAVEALHLTTSMQSLMLNHLLLSALDPETRKSWELRIASQEGIPTTTELLTFLEQRCKALELLPNQLTTTAAPRTKHTSASDNKASRTAHTYVTIHIQCLLCKESHRLMYCDKFINLSPQRRMEVARQHKLCYNCLQPFSKGHACSTHTCRKCGRRHHTFLHVTAHSQAVNDKLRAPSKLVSNRSELPDEATTYCSFKGKPTNHVLLATAIVDIQTKDKQYIPCRILMDSASQLNFISESCVRRLGLVKQQKGTHIQGVNQLNTSTQHSVLVKLRSNYTDWKATINCSVLPQITEKTPTRKIDVSSWKLPSKIQLADQQFNTPGPIDLLVGAELFFDMLLPDRQTRHGYPTLQETVLGWIISGTTPVHNTSTVKQQSFFIQDATTLESNLNRFWDLEHVESNSMTSEQTACEQHFVKHTIQQPDGRFEVRLPLKTEARELGFSRRMAENRFLAIERRLHKDPALKKQYCKFMQDYESAGHMEAVPPPTDDSTVCYYLPHHPVFKSTSTTTKTRVVFDGSAKTTSGVALNDILQIGPTIQEDLYSLVLRFRTHVICFTADIEQMYRQISMNQQDRNLQRILWRQSPDQHIQEYCLKTVTYGTASAPFLATRCLKKLAEDNMVSHPKAASVLLNDFYVDDLLSGASTVQEAIEIQQELTTLLAGAGFPLRKWASNNSEFLATIPQQLREMNHAISLDNEDGVMALGLRWSPKNDELQVRYNGPVPPSQPTPHTKRTVLATTASIFDPLGLLSPTVIMYKMFIQTLWQAKLDWDTELPLSLQNKWSQLCHTLPQLFDIKFPRRVICVNANNIEIHGFCD